MLPILYSFRRCPYAIRARMAVHYAGIEVELREVLLKDKPEAMLSVSSKGTVPVLVLPDGQVLDESYDVMCWALNQQDPDYWRSGKLEAELDELIRFNDGEFKTHLDHYKYFDRFPMQPMEYYRSQAENFLAVLEEKLTAQKYLLAEAISLADVAIFPFIRQFAFVDKGWFDNSPYPKLKSWLNSFLNSELFLAVMEKHPVWQEDLK
jgi:glutathione S-transferase